MNPVKKKTLLFSSPFKCARLKWIVIFCFALLNVVTVVTKILEPLIFVTIDLDLFFSLAQLVIIYVTKVSKKKPNLK